LIGEIDSKLYYLNLHTPTIELMDQKSKIAYYSELSEIFDRHELIKAVEITNFTERIYHPGEQLLAKGDLTNKVLYVARGTIVEKDGVLGDSFVPTIKFNKGNIACLQNLLPNTENEPMIADVYASSASISSVTPIDLAYLKEILMKDETKLRKLWEILAYRMIILQFEKLL
jgi:hypothetical protein